MRAVAERIFMLEMRRESLASDSERSGCRENPFGGSQCNQLSMAEKIKMKNFG